MGRPTTIAASLIDDRLIERDEAIELVASMTIKLWSYPLFAQKYNKSKKEAIHIMNDLVHHGLMIFVGVNKHNQPIFERCPYVPEKW